MPNPIFLQELATLVQRQQATVATEWAMVPDAALATQPGSGRWSALECIEHLNRYCRYYNPALTTALRHAAPVSETNPEPVRYSWLGRKSVALVQPANSKAHKTLARMNPSTAPQPPREVLQEFIDHQDALLKLLEQSISAALNRRAVPIEFFKLLKLRLGEAFEFVVQHQQRHLLQAGRAIEQATNGAQKPA